LDRWLNNQRIEVHQRYGLLRQHAVAEWGTNVRYLALDTSTLGDTYGLGRISLIYRGRAMPRVWKVLQHPGRRVADDAYSD
jgi:hypothetical protein